MASVGLSLATWNVNSVRARLPLVEAWLETQKHDVVCLQEIKCQKHQFPSFARYNVAVAGQKAYHGVAILSRSPIDVEETSLPHHQDDTQARFLQVLVQPPDAPVVRVVCLYAPNGNPVSDEQGGTHEKFLYKRSWMKCFFQHAKALLEQPEDLIMMGDYNIIPTANDAKHPENWEGDACYHPEMKALYTEMLALGYKDVLREAFPDEEHLYTFWDYKTASWRRNNGVRIDHILTRMKQMRITGVGVEKEMRAKERPSDHVPVWVKMKA